MFVLAHIAQLIGDTQSFTNFAIDIPMRMAINPIINPAVSDEITEFYCECTIYTAVFKLVCHKHERRDMMRRNYNILCLAFRYGLFNKSSTTKMLLIKPLAAEPEATISDAPKVADSPFSQEFFNWRNVSPKC